MPESEYHRVYRHPSALQAGTPEPDHLHLAGLSSAELAVTQEPAVGHKRKAPEHDRRVTFTTDYTEHGSPIKEDDKAMRFRAGFRRVNVTTPTEYQLQYCWKTPANESPLLNAENMLHRGFGSSTQGQTTSTRVTREGEREGGAPSSRQHRREAEQDGSERNGQPEGGQQNGEALPEEEGGEGEGREIQPPLQPVGATNPTSQRKKKRKKKSKHPSLSALRLVSEYQTQFKSWPIAPNPPADGGHARNADVFGSPKKLTDPSDPRLLKHTPLPLNKKFHIPSAQWGTEYSSNFASPKKFKFVAGAWRGAPQPDLFYQGLVPVHPEAEDGEDNREEPLAEDSWFNQVVELRQKAVRYKKRAEGSYFSRDHLRQLEQEQRDLFERASSVLSSQSSSETSSQTSQVGPQEGDMRVDDIEEGEHGENEGRGEPDAMAFRPQRIAHSGMARRGQPLPSGEANENPNNNVEVGEREGEGVALLPGPGTNANSSNNNPPVGDEPAVLEPVDEYEGRIPTPVLRKAPTYSTTSVRRHHLDLTTPSTGGLLVSPVKLPFPPVSPKYRRDMRSVAPIFPSPRPTTPEQQRLQQAMRGDGGARQTLAGDLRQQTLPPPRNQPSSSQPGPHMRANVTTQHCASSLETQPPVPVRPNPAPTHHASGAVRRLQFASTGQRNRERDVTHSHTHSAPSQSSCRTCGARLHSFPVRTPSLQPHQCHTCGATSSLRPSTTTTRHLPTGLGTGRSSRPHGAGSRAERQRGVPFTHQDTHPQTRVAPPARSSSGLATHTSQRVSVPLQQPTSPSFAYPTRPVGQWPPTMGSRPLAGGRPLARDVDELSLSSMSLSSCSVASEVLRRAQERRDHFWQQPQET